MNTYHVTLRRRNVDGTLTEAQFTLTPDSEEDAKPELVLDLEFQANGVYIENPIRVWVDELSP